MQMRDGGRVCLCALEDISDPGLMPVEKLVIKARPFFSKRTISTIRRNTALGTDQQFDLIIRCWNITQEPPGVSYAVMPDGKQYHANFNPVVDEDALDVTLTRLEDYYEVNSDGIKNFI